MPPVLSERPWVVAEGALATWQAHSYMQRPALQHVRFWGHKASISANHMLISHRLQMLRRQPSAIQTERPLLQAREAPVAIAPDVCAAVAMAMNI